MSFWAHFRASYMPHHVTHTHRIYIYDASYARNKKKETFLQSFQVEHKGSEQSYCNLREGESGAWLVVCQKERERERVQERNDRAKKEQKKAAGPDMEKRLHHKRAEQLKCVH